MPRSSALRVAALHRATYAKKRLHKPFGRTRNDVAADELADLLGGLGPGFDGRAHAADVAADDGGDIARRRCRPA